MKTHFLNFAAAALIVLAAASCNKEEIINTGGDGTKAIALSISIGEPGTKAYNIDDRYEDNYDDFTRLDIYFTNMGGTILYHWTASAEATDDDGKTLWSHFVTNQNGVKFLGLSGDVTGVYVVANVPDLKNGEEVLGNGEITTGANIKDLNAHLKLTYYDPMGEQNSMPYAGGDITLAPTPSVSENAGEIHIDGSEESGNYVKADIHLRPAISRVEIEKVGVKTQGINYYKYADGNIEQVVKVPQEINAEEAYYSVSWQNFNIDFIGVYMSDVYRQTNLFPASSTIAQWDIEENFFDTPVFENASAPIMEGKWVSLEEEQALNRILAYSDYDNNSYNPITVDGYTSRDDDRNISWLFSGGAESPSTNTMIIPFHFFVPYDVTEETLTKVGEQDEVDPKLHFQFNRGVNYSDETEGFNVTEIKKFTSENTSGDVIPAGEDIYDQLKVMYEWPVAINDGTAYANVIKFVDEQGGNITIQPGYIYRLKEVWVDPTHLNPAPSNDDVNDIYVEVKVVPFKVQDVYPVFE